MPKTENPTPKTENLPAEVDPVEDVLDPEWEHQRISFAGDDLAVRAPTTQALTGFSLASSKYVDNQIRNDMTGLFIVEHIGPESYGRVMQRLMDGDDPAYTTDTVGLLMRDIVMLTTQAVTTEE
jgi:hypothetical protein